MQENYVILLEKYGLSATLDCGQAFRWRQISPEGAPQVWEGAAFGHALRLREQDDSFALSCTPEEFRAVWRDYFDWETDYEAARSAIAAMSPVLAEAVDFAPGLRLLRQEPWEALCSFLLSQNNHIPRIKGIIEALCRLLGEPIPGSALYAFPGPEAFLGLTAEDLAPLRAGYRAKYLLDAAKKVTSGEVSLEEVAGAPVEQGRELLRRIAGVGPKVAECVLLYGFHKTECFPMDVWMKRAMTVLLPGVSPDAFGEHAGLAQQYLFHYSRLHPSLFDAP